MRLAEIHWYEAHGIGKKEFKIKLPFFGLGMEEARFVVCIDNSGYESSLEFGKIYQVVPDEAAENEGLIRIIDESGEDYGYALERFHAVALPQTLERVLRAA